MCNRKDEGGRCYAHLNQFIHSLDKREEQEIYNGALKAGVPLDEEELRKQTAAALTDVEQAREEHKADVIAKRELMMSLHEKARRELRHASVLRDRERRGAFIPNPFAKDDEPETRVADLPAFAKFDGAHDYINTKRFTSAVAMEKRKVQEQLADARAEHKKNSEKEAVRNNMELRSLKRQILLADAKDMLSSGADSHNLYRLESEYDKKLKAEIDANGTPFHETDECKRLVARTAELDSEFSHAQEHERAMEREFSKHLHGNTSISSKDRADHNRLVQPFLAHKKEDYEQFKGEHYARRFRDAKESYVNISNSEPNWKSRQDKAVKDLTKNPPLKKEALETYKATVYPTTDVAKEIKGQREAAQKELALTPTYRKNMKERIDRMYYEGHDTTKAREVLRKLDSAAADKRKRTTSAMSKRPKREETEEAFQRAYPSNVAEVKLDNIDALADNLYTADNR